MSEKLTGLQRMILIQSELKAPKNQFNGFGKYKYRSCEDILEALKPLLAKYQGVLTINDTMTYIGDRYYIKANAMVMFSDETVFETNGYAREEESKKGMDGSQITGTASSYARKYALNGLFCIDDTKDSDATNDHGKAPAKQVTEDDIQAAIAKIGGCNSLEKLKEVYMGLHYAVKANKDVVAAKEKMKDSLTVYED